MDTKMEIEMICDKCGEDKEVNCILELRDARDGMWKTFHFCGIGCLSKFIIENVEAVE
jgi:hypothetical protein